jgi:hypothetical protein
MKNIENHISQCKEEYQTCSLCNGTGELDLSARELKERTDLLDEEGEIELLQEWNKGNGIVTCWECGGRDEPKMVRK